MIKRLKLTTRAFGAEPGIPDVAQLSEWIAEHRGTLADLTTYQLFQSLAPQLEAGIGHPCAGGKFCADRIRSSLLGVASGCATDEIAVHTEALIEDAAGIVVQKRNSWCALPAPHVLGLIDGYYHDDEEWSDALTGAYGSLMRAMRDIGIAGHVLICDKADEMEIAALAALKVFFFQPDADRNSLECLMEHQRQIAVRPKQLETVFDLTDEYDLRKIIIVDADAEAIKHALSHLDPDQVSVGGYCLDEREEYWKNLVDAAVYTR
ncbi:MAG: hypothetical protein Q8N94_08950 [Methanoregula sp.]|nr:hypothetical protein [Methanoregula sp.]